MTARRGAAGADDQRPDDGSATIWVLVVALGLSAMTALGLWVASVTAAHRKAAGAADLAALAAVAALSQSPSPGVGLPASVAGACAEARRVTVLNGAELASCRIEADGSVLVLARVEVALLPPVVVAARAGYGSVGSFGAPSSTASSSDAAPALSSGSLPLPHLGDCTHDGQPAAQLQSPIAALVASSQARASP